MNRRARRRGHAMAGSMVMLVLAMLLWVALYRQMAGFLRTERICRLRAEHAEGPARAMAWALALLTTGNPPEDVYSCRVTVDDQTGDTYVIWYKKETGGRYDITVRPVTSDDSSLPLAPESF